MNGFAARVRRICGRRSPVGRWSLVFLFVLLLSIGGHLSLFGAERIFDYSRVCSWSLEILAWGCLAAVFGATVAWLVFSWLLKWGRVIGFRDGYLVSFWTPWRGVAVFGDLFAILLLALLAGWLVAGPGFLCVAAE